jgi:selenium metabolism protein YedF
MRGKPCPIPVVNAKKALAEQEGVTVIVDNVIAVQNLEKMAAGSGWGFSYTQEGESRYTATIIKDPHKTRQEVPAEPLPKDPAPGCGKQGPVVLVTADTMGRGSEELGRLLIKGFIFSLTQLHPLPEALIFLNGGAHLTTKGANTLEDLKALEAQGTEIYTCGTCANYYHLTEALAVGSLTDMLNISGKLAKASSVITL